MTDQHSSDDTFTFRHSFLKVFLFEAMVFSLFCSIIRASGDSSAYASWGEFALDLLVFFLPVLTVVTGLIIGLTWCGVSETGLNLQSFWGGRRDVAWDDIEDVSFEKWSPYTLLPTFRLKDRRSGKTLYYPKCLVNQRDFDELVLRYSPEGCLIRIAAMR